MKGYISGVGALIACIFVPTCFLVPINFWISISSLFFIVFFSEVWTGNTISMINKILPSNSQGVASSVFGIANGVAGSTATFVLGILGDKLHADQNSIVYGYLLGGTVLISYIVCCPLFICAGRAYHIKQANLMLLH